MISITIEYKPLGFLWKRMIETSFPERWNEMTPDQLTAVPKLYRGKISDSQVLQIFFGIKQNIAWRIDSYQRYRIIKNLDFIKKPGATGIFIINEIAGFRSPGKNLKGVTFGAFIFGDTYYQNYISGKRGELDKFIACYYCNRKGFDDNLVDEHAALIKKSNIAKREAIAINYGLIREWLSELFPYVFRKVEKREKNQKNVGWVMVFDGVVGSDIVRQHDYAMLPAMEVLRFLNSKTKEYYKNGGKV